MEDERWEDDDDEALEDAEEEDFDEDYDSDENPLPSASKYPPSKAQTEEDEKFKTWLSHTKDSM